MNLSDAHKAILAYAQASKDAEQNTTIMCGYPSSEQVDQCAQRMEILDKAEKALNAFKGKDGVPIPLRNYLEADADKGCVGCWVSSIRKNHHPDCMQKINRWFECRESLVQYGLSLSPKE